MTYWETIIIIMSLLPPRATTGPNLTLIKNYIDQVKSTSTAFSTKQRILNEIFNFLQDDLYKQPFANPEYGLVPYLLQEIIKPAVSNPHQQETTNDTNVLTIPALKCIWIMSRAMPNRHYFGLPSLGLIPLFMEINKNPYITHDRKHFIFLTLVNVSLCEANHAYLFQDEIGFLEYYSRPLKITGTDTAAPPPLPPLATVLPAVAPVPLPPPPPMFLTPAQQSAANLYAFRLFGNLVNPTTCTNFYIPYLRKFQIPMGIWQRIFTSSAAAGTMVTNWPGRIGGIEYWALNFFMRLSYYPMGKCIFLEELKCSNFFGFLLTMIDENPYTLEALKGLFILINIFDGILPDISELTITTALTTLSETSPMLLRQQPQGFTSIGLLSDGGEGSKKAGVALLEKYPEFFPLCLKILEKTLELSVSDLFLEVIINNKATHRSHHPLEGYTFGIITILKFTYTWKKLALEPKNREIIIQQTLVPSLPDYWEITTSFYLLMVKILNAYVKKESEFIARYDYTIHSGGGKDDHQSILNLLEFLLLLSYCENEILREAYLQNLKNCEILKLINAIYDERNQESSITPKLQSTINTIKQVAGLLLSILDTK